MRTRKDVGDGHGPGEKNHEAMMKDANKVPNNTVFFMDNGSSYSTSGTLIRPAISICPDPKRSTGIGPPLRVARTGK